MRAGCSFLRDATAALRSSSAGEMVDIWVGLYHIGLDQLVPNDGLQDLLGGLCGCHSKAWSVIGSFKVATYWLIIMSLIS